MKDLPAPYQIIPNILIVDDIPANLVILNDILEANGYMVRPVLSGALALQVAEKEKPDLILLDIMMPEMDGYEVCRRFKENKLLRDTPIIFISALSDTDDVVKAFRSGGVDYITKPFRAEEVSARVATHLMLHKQKNELQALNAAKDKFFSIIAHDLRGPFNGFLGLTQIMAEELSTLTMAEIGEIAVDMKSSATNLFRLLENLLTWASVQQGLIPFEPKNISLRSVTIESMGIINEPAKSKGIELACHIDDGLMVFADKDILKTIIRNLVSNAIKFTPKGGKITVSAKTNPDKTVEVAVTDTGIGMNIWLIDRLFLLGEKTGRKGTDGEPSNGLGLMLCKEFVEQHGGTIWAESEEGNGSRFYFTLKAKN